MEFDLASTLGVLAVIIAIGIGGLAVGGVMPTRVILMMVLPSMIAFAAVVFALGVKHGEYRQS